MAQKIYIIQFHKIIDAINEADKKHLLNPHGACDWGISDPKHIKSSIRSAYNEDQIIHVSNIVSFIKKFETKKMPSGANSALDMVTRFLNRDRDIL